MVTCCVSVSDPKELMRAPQGSNRIHPVQAESPAQQALTGIDDKPSRREDAKDGE